MAGVACSNTIRHRNQFGRWSAAIEAAGEPAMREIAEEGAQLSRDFAPRGSKEDPRTGHLNESIDAEATGSSARWIARARHALAVEFGGAPHPQTGWANFFWDAAGRDWVPGPNQIRHPGNPAHPYLRPAFDIMMGKALDIMRKYYP